MRPNPIWEPALEMVVTKIIPYLAHLGDSDARTGVSYHPLLKILNRWS